MINSTPFVGRCLKLPASAVRLRKNGIEFVSEHPIPEWTEMTVSLEIPGEKHVVHCTGTIVACSGNCRSGYKISMLFTDLSSQSQARLNFLAHPTEVPTLVKD